MGNILNLIKKGQQADGYIYDAIGYEPSHREKDENGRLIVKRTLITKGCVSPYWGEEIPDWQALGLDPKKKYNVYRPIEELKKAHWAPTMPLLNKHIMDYADTPQKENWAGSVSNIDIEGDNVYGDICFWNNEDIDNVENGTKKDLSMGYRCKHVKESGEYNGQPYDLKMVNILPNHLALVEKGRVKGAYVFDEDKIKGEMTMIKKLASILGGLGVKDEDIKELEEMAESSEKKEVEAKDACDAEHEDKRKLIDEIGGMLKGKVDEELWRTIIGKAEKLAYEGSEKSEADDEALEEKKEVEEVKAEEVKKDEEPEKEVEVKQEIDLDKIKEEAKAEARKEMEELAKAKDEVEEVAGKCAVQDSAAKYYKIGLEAMGISVKGVMDEDLRGMFRGAVAKTSKKGTMDAAPKQAALNETLGKLNLPKRVY